MPIDQDLGSLARAFQTSRLPAVSIAEALPDEDIAALRAEVEGAQFEMFDLAHIGQYEHSAHPLYEPIRTKLCALVENVVGRPVSVAKHRWLRFRRGSYSLVRDDLAWCREVSDAPVELCLDVSASSSREAEVVYTHRDQAYFTIPQRPGEVGIVMRGPTIHRYDRYLTYRIGEAIVYRLRVALS